MRELIILALLLIVFGMYLATLVFAPSYAKDLLEIFKYVVVAVVAYYLGYTTREVTGPKRRTNSAGGLTNEQVRRLGYIAVGFGIALIIQHVVLYGVDLTLLSHEWVGLMVLIGGLLMIGLANNRGSTGVANIVAEVLLILIAVALVLMVYLILAPWVQETLGTVIEEFRNCVLSNLARCC